MGVAGDFRPGRFCFCEDLRQADVVHRGLGAGPVGSVAQPEWSWRIPGRPGGVLRPPCGRARVASPVAVADLAKAGGAAGGGGGRGGCGGGCCNFFPMGQGGGGGGGASQRGTRGGKPHTTRGGGKKSWPSP